MRLKRQCLTSSNKSWLTKRAPDAGESGAIPSLFPVGRLHRPRPSAGNANRWVVVCKKVFKGKAVKNSEVSSRVIFISYKFLLPACTLILLLVISQNLKRSLYGGSQGFDLFVRIFIIFGLCSAYIRLSDLDKYMFKTYSIKIDHSNDNNLPMNWRNIISGSLFGILSIPLTWWIIHVFLPIFSGTSLFLALLHGFILSFPIIFRRKTLVW